MCDNDHTKTHKNQSTMHHHCSAHRYKTFLRQFPQQPRESIEISTCKEILNLSTLGVACDRGKKLSFISKM